MRPSWGFRNISFDLSADNMIAIMIYYNIKPEVGECVEEAIMRIYKKEYVHPTKRDKNLVKKIRNSKLINHNFYKKFKSQMLYYSIPENRDGRF